MSKIYSLLLDKELNAVFDLIFFHLLARRPNLENISIYSNKFFYNFHLSESSLTCPGHWVSGLRKNCKCKEK